MAILDKVTTKWRPSERVSFRYSSPQWGQACVEMLTHIVVTTGTLQVYGHVLTTANMTMVRKSEILSCK